MVNVTHEGDDRSAEFLFLGLFLNRLRRLDDYLLLLVDAGAGNALLTLKDKSVKLAELARDLGLHRLVDVGKNLHPHQILDDLEGRNIHLGRQFLDLDGRLDVDDLARVLARGGDLLLHRDLLGFWNGSRR